MIKGALRNLAVAIVCVVLNVAGSHRAAHALIFEFSPEPGTPQAAASGLSAAGDLLSSIFTDSVNLDIGFRFSLEPPGAASTLLEFPYQRVREALGVDQTSASDLTAVSNLQSGPALDLLINRTSDNRNGVGSPVPYLDNDGSANNTTIRITASNAKALSLDRADALGESIFLGGDLSRDAVIILDPFGIAGFPWDFDRTDGVAAGTLDFTGIVIHELWHVLGFCTGVDVLDRFFILPAEDQLTWINTLELFRFSEESLAFGEAVIDWTINTTEKFFSIDGGATRIADFRTGLISGDGGYPGHWKFLGTGIMDDFLIPFIGSEAQLSTIDITAIDVIGWNISVVSVPEPSTLALILLGVAFLLWKQKSARFIFSSEMIGDIAGSATSQGPMRVTRTGCAA